MAVCRARHTHALARLLLSAGADVHQRCNGKSLLNAAIQSGDDPRMVQILLDAGADFSAPMDVTSGFGVHQGGLAQVANPVNALAFAARLARINSFRLLRRAGACISTARTAHDALLWSPKPFLAPTTAERLDIIKLMLADEGDAPPLAAAAAATFLKLHHVVEIPSPSALDYDMAAQLAHYTNRARLAASTDTVNQPVVSRRLAGITAALQRLSSEKQASDTLALLKNWSTHTANRRNACRAGNSAEGPHSSCSGGAGAAGAESLSSCSSSSATAAAAQAKAATQVQAVSLMCAHSRSGNIV